MMAIARAETIKVPKVMKGNDRFSKPRTTAPFSSDDDSSSACFESHFAFNFSRMPASCMCSIPCRNIPMNSEFSWSPKAHGSVNWSSSCSALILAVIRVFRLPSMAMRFGLACKNSDCHSCVLAFMSHDCKRYVPNLRGRKTMRKPYSSCVKD